MTIKRKIIEIDEELCNGCGDCVPSCAEGAIQIINGKAKLVADKYCDGLGECLGDCPTGALKVVEREAEDFSEEAVAEHIKAQKSAPAPHAGGCPSAMMRSFATNNDAPSTEASQEPTNSELTHWPVQIRLISPMAPFLENADLLVTADCVPIAFRRYHGDFLKGKVVMMGCPKFDDIEMYQERFEQIFAAQPINSVTVLVMEVPCCQGLPIIVQNAMEKAGKNIPLAKVVVSLQGEIL